MTNDELTTTRTAGQRSEMILTISKPSTVLTASISATPASNDGVIELSYTTVSGNYALVVAGMTALVSSGGVELGRVRMRKAPTASVLYIGKTSAFQFATGLTVTVLVDAGLWAKEPNGDYLDEDIPFSASVYLPPIVRMGPAAKILLRGSGTVLHIPDASASVSPLGHALSYQWVAPYASATSDMTTSRPSITYNADGEFMEGCIVTDTVDGSSAVGFRKIFINPDGCVVSADKCSGDVDAEGWSFPVTGYSGVILSELRDQSLAVLWSLDYFGGTLTDLGPLADFEKVKFIGWVGKETINWHPGYTSVDFDIFGPAEWLRKIGGFAFTLTDTTAAADTWGKITALTLDQALARLIGGYTTLGSITDVYLSGLTTRLPKINVNSGNVWGQLKALAEQNALCFPLCDRYGRLFIERPTWLLPAASRSSVPAIINLTTADWLPDASFERIKCTPTSMIEMLGKVWDGTNSVDMGSRAPGNCAETFGDPKSPYNELVVDSQDELNQLSGDYFAHENNPYVAVEITLKYNLLFVDIAPRQVVTVTLSATDNQRGLACTEKRFIPIAVSLAQRAKSGAVLTSLVCEAETSGVAGVTYFPPVPPPPWDPPIEPPIVPPDPYGPNPDIPPIVPPVIIVPPTCVDSGLGGVWHALAWSKSSILGTDTDRSAYAMFPCTIRGDASMYYRTKLTANLNILGDAAGKIHCYAIDGARNRLMEGTTSDSRSFDFQPVSPLAVAGFEIALEAGEGVGPFTYICGNIFRSGSVDAINESGTQITGLTPGAWYSLESEGGPWFAGVGGAPIANGSLNWSFHIDQHGDTWTSQQLGLGWSSTSSFNVMYTLLPPGHSFLEILDGFHVRTYFKSAEASFYYRVGDNNFADNSGSLGYIVRNATRKGERQILLGGSVIWNVCDGRGGA